MRRLFPGALPPAIHFEPLRVRHLAQVSGCGRTRFQPCRNRPPTKPFGLQPLKPQGPKKTNTTARLRHDNRPPSSWAFAPLFWLLASEFCCSRSSFIIHNSSFSIPPAPDTCPSPCLSAALGVESVCNVPVIGRRSHPSQGARCMRHAAVNSSRDLTVVTSSGSDDRH